MRISGRPSQLPTHRPGTLAAVLALAAAMLIGPSAADSQQAAPSRKKIDDAELARLLELHHAEEEEVRLVLLPAVVTNRRGRPVRDLKPADFTLFEDYVPQEIRYFNVESSQPIGIAFLLDVSGSMRQVGKLDEAKEAIRVFIDSLAAHDQFGLVCFADDQVTWVTEFTSDRERFLRRLEVQEAYGQTALFDAVAAAPKLVDGGSHGQEAIVLITDGNDNASRMNTFKATQLARSVNVPIYTIGFSTIPRKLLPKGTRERSHRILNLFASETGGRHFTVEDPDDLKEAVLTIKEELGFQYVIGYRPTRTLWDGGFRRVKLEPTRDGLTVRTRSGYYAQP